MGQIGLISPMRWRDRGGITSLIKEEKAGMVYRDKTIFLFFCVYQKKVLPLQAE